jgi:predicted branched-subunit amino acid permease
MPAVGDGAVTPDSPGDWSAQRRAVVTRSLSVGIAVGTYGLSFGALSVAAGLTLGQTAALSALTFTGASQFALVGVVAVGGGAWTGVAAALFLGIRNALYGLSLAPMLAVRGWRRLASAQLVIDESTAVAISQPHPRAARLGFYATGIATFLVWNLATMIGAVATQALGDPNAWGLDAAVAAGFLALLWPRLAQRSSRWVAAGAAALALLLTPFLPPGVPVLLAAVVALVAAWPEPSPVRP